ncbi:MAG: hypothetical protein HFF55_00065 [Lawsonibacter sp.]|nr:hypothetical protein [Lawsonibacter sp.]MCI9568060.1 hypothetical protein [Lawsonibacter sp.]
MSKRCPECRSVNDDSRLFCATCGATLDSDLRLIQDLEKQKTILTKTAPPQKQDDYDDEDYVPPVSSRKKSGCYVATAVYGSYDCPQVWVLRRFRDSRLAPSPLGRAFIRLYYAVSPALVRWFGGTAWFRRLWRGPLDRLVQALRAQGVPDGPYQDRDW